MLEIPEIDLAWETVNALGASSARNKALQVIEQAGGKDPRPRRILDAAEHSLGEFKQAAENQGLAEVAAVLARAIANIKGDVTAPAIVTKPNGLTIANLACAYKADKQSGYNKVRYRTRENYGHMIKRIEHDHGDQLVQDIQLETQERWHEEWTKTGFTSALGLTGMLRTLFRYGSKVLQDSECVRLVGITPGMPMPRPKTRETKITRGQVIAVCAKANELGQHALALAQALQFELALGQRDVIGEWVPQSEPGNSDILRGEDKWRDKGKWLRGLRWSSVDENMILRHVTSKENKPIEVDLKLAPMVLEELALMFGHADISREHLPPSGPIVIDEYTGLPYTVVRFRRKWRKIATAAGIPEHVCNMDSRAAGRNVPANERTKLKAHGNGKKLHDKVRAALPPLPDQVRSDVAHDLIVDVLEGKIAEADLKKVMPQYVRKHYAGYDNRFSTLSLNQPVPGTVNQRWDDRIAADHEVWK